MKFFRWFFKNRLRPIFHYVRDVPILQFSIGIIIAGIVGAYFYLTSLYVGVAGIILLGSLLMLGRRSSQRWGWLFVGMIIWGIRSALVPADLPEDHISRYNGEDLSITVVVTDQTVRKSDRTSAVVETVNCFFVDDKIAISATGKIQTWLPRYPRVREGDILVLTGMIQEPEDDPESDFSYSAYLEGEGVYSLVYRPEIEYTGRRTIGILKKLIVDGRDIMVSKINRNLPEPHASLLSGILFGVRAEMPEDFGEALRRTGTTHIIAASGYNVTIVANSVAGFASFLNRRMRILFSIFGVWLFVVLSGASLPVVRAGIMVTLALLAVLVGSQSRIHIALPVSAAIMEIATPGVISNISFLLSFLSTAGLIYLVPVFKRFCSWIPESLEEGTLVTMSATVATLPIIVGTFGTVSLLSLPVNFLVIPIISMVMGIGVGIVVVPQVLEPVLRAVSLVAWFPLEYFVRVVSFFAAVPFASVDVGKQGGVAVIGVYMLLVFVVIVAYPGSDHTELFKDLRV